MGNPVRVLELRSVRGTGGGPEKTILLGAARSDPSRHAVTVCYLRDSRDAIFHIDKRAEKVPIDYVEIPERHSLDPAIWRPLRRLMRDRRIDIVHAHEYKTDLLALLLSRVEGTIPLATAHGWTGHSWKERRLYYPIDRWLLSRYPQTIAVSSEIKRAIVAAGARPENVAVVLNGIDHEAFRRDSTRRSEARARFGFSEHDVAIGAIGRLEPQKNFPLLIEVFAGLASGFPNARLVIAGNGSLHEHLESIIQAKGLTERCRLLGLVSDVALLHHALDVFVQSSDYEGTPNAVLEAMAFETPLVATAAGGTAELARDGEEGLIVEPRDSAGLATAIRSVLSDPVSAAARAVRARRRVETDLSFANRMRKVEGIYDDLVRRFPRPVRQ